MGKMHSVVPDSFLNWIPGMTITLDNFWLMFMLITITNYIGIFVCRHFNSTESFSEAQDDKPFFFSIKIFILVTKNIYEVI